MSSVSEPYGASLVSRRIAGPAFITLIARVVSVVGLAAAVWGAWHVIGGVSQTKAYVTVPVQVRNPSSLIAGGAGSGVFLGRGLGQGREIRLDFAPSATKERGVWLDASPDAVAVKSWDSTLGEQLLNGAAGGAIGLCVGIGAFPLRRLLLSIARGEPFEDGNPSRIVVIATLTVAGGLIAALTPGIASGLVLHRLGLDGASSPVAAPGFEVPFVPLAVAALLLVLAEAFRRGGDLARDVDGLV